MASSAFREESFDETRRPAAGEASSHGARQDAGAPAPAAAARLDDASSVDHVQEKPPPAAPLKKRQKFKRHCGRFKWWYLAGLVIFLAIILPVLGVPPPPPAAAVCGQRTGREDADELPSFLVILPAVVQRIVDDQPLPIKGGAFLVLSPTQMMVSLETSLDTPLPAKIEPLTLFLYNKETPEFSPFLNLTLPEQHVDGNTPIIVTNQTVTITNKTELVTWFDNVFDQPKVELSCRGGGVVRLGALKSDTHLEKTVEVSSLNQLSGFSIQELRLLMPPEDNGNNVKGTLNLPNWGDLTLGLGNLTLNLLSGDIPLGFLTVYDVLLPPGNNTRSFAGQLFLDELVPNFGTILENQAEALAEGMIRIDVTGKETLVNGQHIDFVEEILNNKRIVSKVPVVKLLADVLNSFTDGGDMSSLFDLVGNTFGNKTLLAQALDHWGPNATVAAATKRAPAPPRRIGPSALTVFKLGMKMMAWKR